MKTTKAFFNENRVLYYITLILWLSASVTGVFCALNLEGGAYKDISSYVKQTLSDEMSMMSFIKIGTFDNIEFLIVILLLSTAPFFIPLTLALTAFKGFAAGFTAAVIIRIYSLKGAFLCLGTVVLPYAFLMPIIFLMTISALKFSLEKGRGRGSYYDRGKGNVWFSYVTSQSLLTLILCLITILESFISKILIKLMR